MISEESKNKDEDTAAVIVLSDSSPTGTGQEKASVIIISDSTTSTVFTPTKR